MMRRQKKGILHSGFFLLVIALTGCTNNQLQSLLNNSKLASPNPTLDSQDNIFTISNVVISNTDSSLFEVVDASGAIGDFCITESSETAFGPSTCQCEYQYNDFTGSPVTQRVDTTYVETNLLRCSLESLTSQDVDSVKVGVYVQQASATTNLINVNFGTASGSLQSDNPLAFVDIKRYQCQQIITIPHMFCNTGDDATCLYDPLQSENTKLVYPLNFSTSNLGGALLSMAQKAGDPGGPGASFFSKFECSLDEDNEKSFVNKILYSVGADSGGSKQIYPTTSSAVNRHDFSLARERTGVFTQPVNAITAPGIFTVSPDPITGIQQEGTFPPVGYAAKAIPSDGGVEVCPEAAATIPTGYKWVKLWAFKASFPVRRYVRTAGQIDGSEGPAGQMACNYGIFPELAASELVFLDCDEGAGGSNETDSLQSPNSQGLAARVFLGSGACVKFPEGTDRDNPQGAYGGIFDDSASAGQSSTEASYTNFPDGADIYEKVSNYGTPSDDPFPEPWNLGAQAADDNDGNDSAIVADDLWGGADQGVPFSEPVIFDLDDSQSTTEYVFVVSDKNVSKTTMVQELPGHEPYTPYRFKNKEDCTSADPDAGGCSDGKKIQYDLHIKEISPSDSSVGSDIYPLCVLQKL